MQTWIVHWKPPKSHKLAICESCSLTPPLAKHLWYKDAK